MTVLPLIHRLHISRCSCRLVLSSLSPLARGPTRPRHVLDQLVLRRTRAFHHETGAGVSHPETASRDGSLDMDDQLTDLVRSIHDSPTLAVIYATGGGMQALSWLLTVPGASKTVLETRIPYGGARSITQVLDKEPVKYASTQTAIDMAESAYKQAANLSPFGRPILGVSCTCALAIGREKKGDHKICIATHNGHSTEAYSLQLAKGVRNRIGEDVVASKLLIQALAEGCGLGKKVEGQGQRISSHEAQITPSNSPEEVVQQKQQSRGDPLIELLEGRIDSVEFSGGQIICNAPRHRRVYLPGSFNPLHDGHRRLLNAACTMCHHQLEDGCFELSVGNPDKGLLPLDEVQRRVKQFTDAGLSLVVTHATLYVEKAKLFPESVFVVGYDTAIRLVMPKYYGGHTNMLLELAALHQKGCRFLVAGRMDENRRFLQLKDVEIPEEIAEKGLFLEIPESAFREDISSTELRNQAEKSQG